MAVHPDGTTLIVSQTSVRLYDTAGREAGGWELPWGEVPREAALWGDYVLFATPARHSIAIFTREGLLIREVRGFQGEVGRFQSPASVTVGPEDELLVIQQDGQALLFRLISEPVGLQFVRAFRVDFRRLPVEPRGCTFDGRDQILIPDPASPVPLVYDTLGRRMMAINPSRDLSTKGFGNAARLRAANDRLYVLDQGRNVIWEVAR
jgi:hypothetical protein